MARYCYGLVWLVVTTALLTVWIRSYFVADVLLWREGRGTSAVWIFRGGLCYQVYWFEGINSTPTCQGCCYRHAPASEAVAFGKGNPFFHPARVPLAAIAVIFLAILALLCAISRQMVKNLGRDKGS